MNIKKRSVKLLIVLSFCGLGVEILNVDLFTQLKLLYLHLKYVQVMMTLLK